jgi:hypothetical protein
LDESILCNELDVFIKAPKHISDVAFSSFVNTVLLWSNLFELVNKVLENNPDESNQSYNK